MSAEGASEVGQATWYGEELQGRRTASGEPFDLNLLTAAHKSLPFGTRVRVTHLKSGQSVEVRINDRNGGREVIDLSKAAAAKIGLVREGRAQVRLDVL
ncbi:MAG: septal ring lytic transglycosylase RlpA family protein [Myxococcales bacterium]|nr:septal ring lytic transglycosylase RlpA family protein [Myxococcales bacterium]